MHGPLQERHTEWARHLKANESLNGLISILQWITLSTFWRARRHAAEKKPTQMKRYALECHRIYVLFSFGTALFMTVTLHWPKELNEPKEKNWEREKKHTSHSNSMCRAIRNHVAWHVAFKRHINFIQQKIYVREIPNKTGFANLWQQQQKKRNQSKNKLFWTSKKTHIFSLFLIHPNGLFAFCVYPF